jgi:hypothetical protein
MRVAFLLLFSVESIATQYRRATYVILEQEGQQKSWVSEGSSAALNEKPALWAGLMDTWCRFRAARAGSFAEYRHFLVLAVNIDTEFCQRFDQFVELVTLQIVEADVQPFILEGGIDFALGFVRYHRS